MKSARQPLSPLTWRVGLLSQHLGARTLGCMQKVLSRSQKPIPVPTNTHTDASVLWPEPRDCKNQLPTLRTPCRNLSALRPVFNIMEVGAGFAT